MNMVESTMATFCNCYVVKENNLFAETLRKGL